MCYPLGHRFGFERRICRSTGFLFDSDKTRLGADQLVAQGQRQNLGANLRLITAENLFIQQAGNPGPGPEGRHATMARAPLRRPFT